MTISVAIVGGGPAGLTLAAALAQQGGFGIAVFERADDHFSAETDNPDRSYTIDITGHGLRAARFAHPILHQAASQHRRVGRSG